MRQFFCFLVVIWAVFAMASMGCGRSTEFGRQMRNVDSKERVSTGDSGAVPIVPEATQKLFEDSDVIAYADIDSVENKIEKVVSVGIPPQGPKIFPSQRCTASFLWILKGDVGLQNETVPLIKEMSRYYLSENEKRVLYLRKDGDLFRTVDRFGAEHRLVSALCDIRNLKKKATTGGIVASFHQESHKSLRPAIHILRGRQKASLKVNDRAWGDSLLKTSNIGMFDICEVPLPEGIYTVLMESDGVLFSYTRLTNGYFPCVIVGKYRWWEPLYFGP